LSGVGLFSIPDKRPDLKKWAMLWIVLHSLALVGSLTSSNFSEWISDNQTIPVFLRIESQWCQHCRTMNPAWDRVKSKYRDDTTLLISDISQDIDKLICNSFPGSGTPRLFWVTSGSGSAIRYFDSYSYEALLGFIKKKTSPHVTLLANHDEYMRALEDNPEESLFFLNERGSDLVENFLVNLSKSIDQHPARFFKFGYEEFYTPGLVYHFGMTNQTIFHDKLSDLKSVESFVQLHSFPSIFSASSFFMKFVSKKSYFLLFFQGVDVPFKSNITRLTRDFPPQVKTGILTCPSEPDFCAIFQINPYRGTQLILVRPAKNIHYRFHGKWTDENVIAWFNRALNGKEQALGPGAGWHGVWFNLRVQMKREDFWWRAGITAAVILGGAIVVRSIFRGVSDWVNEDKIAERRRITQLAEKHLEEVANAAIEELIREDEEAMKRQ
jgi:thiol-disulfide isomerase/thioredoxin